MQYLSILAFNSKREYGLSIISSSQRHAAAHMMNVTGGGASANKEVNEKSQAGPCFVRQRMKSYIHQLEKSQTLERKEWVQSKQNKIQERRR